MGVTQSYSGRPSYQGKIESQSGETTRLLRNERFPGNCDVVYLGNRPLR